MAISKATAADSRPFASPPPAVGEGKSLTIKVDATTYLDLREFCTERLRETGQRVTHQQVVVEALKAFLAAR